MSDSLEALKIVGNSLRDLMEAINKFADELPKNEGMGKAILYKLILDLQKAHCTAMDTYFDRCIVGKMIGLGPSKASSPTGEK